MPQMSSYVRIFVHFINVVLAIVALAVILFLAVPIGFYGMAMYLSPTLPSVSEIKTAGLEMPLQIYSKDNKLIGQYGNRMSLPVSYDEIPQEMINGFLAAEDSSFYEHSGISIKGLGRAITEAITDDDDQTGGSTITMQVAKNYFLTSDRTFNRKLTELFLARRIEEELSKEEILTLYVNKIYMGEGAYGIKAGAKKYFSKNLESLTTAEIATLAGLPKAPSQNNPVARPNEALERRNWILDRMYKLGYISKSNYDEAVNSPLSVHLYKEKLDTNMPYLAEMARRSLVDKYGAEVMNSGWRVKLTVDSKDQSEADTAIKKGLIGYDRRHGWRGVESKGEPLDNFVTYSNMEPAKVTEVAGRSFKAELKNGDVVTVPWSGMSWAKIYKSANSIKGYPRSASSLVEKGDIVRLIANKDRSSWRLTQIPKVQGSLVALDPETGAVKTLVGGFDFRYSKFNRATQGWRQPGSIIKPLNYSAALEKGFTPDSMISDDPIRVGNWRPKNADRRHYGDMTLRRGLYLSRNLVSIRLLRSIGTDEALHLLDKFGLEKEQLPSTLSLALGAGQATPLQMATAYATFANGGHRIQPYFIDQIYNFNGNLLYLANPKRACATCFNKNLDKFNEELQSQYETQLNEDANKLNESPESVNEKIQNQKVTDSSNNAEINGEPNSVNAESADSNQTLLDATYDGGPKSDRLKPSLIQYSPAEQAPRILTPKTAFQMAGILRDVIQRGTAKRARALGRSDIGGKTGTTNNFKDAWFAGFHPTIVSVVWVGFDKPSTLGRGEYGGITALPIWVNFMRTQLKDTPRQWVTLNNESRSKKVKTDVIDASNKKTSKQIVKQKSTLKEDTNQNSDDSLNSDSGAETVATVPVASVSERVVEDPVAERLKPKSTLEPKPKPQPEPEPANSSTTNN